MRLKTRFRCGLVFKAHRLVNHSTLGLRVIKKKKRLTTCELAAREAERLEGGARGGHGSQLHGTLAPSLLTANWLERLR